MRRNPSDPQRRTEANEQRTIARIDQYRGIQDLLRTWEDEKITPIEVQIRNHAYIIRLRARERNVKNYLLHRSDAKADV
jgi:hypothetical protein